MKLIEMVKAYSGLVFGKTDYWHPITLANESIKADKIGAYYIDMRPKHIYMGEFDLNHIPLLDFDGELKYFPVTIAQYTLGNFDKFIDTNDKKYFDICENSANWFVNNLEELISNSYGYPNYIDKDIYKLKSPWISSLSQAQAMSVLSRCYTINKKQEYLDICNKLLNTFDTKSADKGLLTLLNSEYFYEEYPSEIPSYVLNGFIFSLWGLLDFYIVSGSAKALNLYNKGLITLKQNIHLYNISGLNWSKYDLYPFKIKDITSIFYHRLHIEQLKAMYLLTNEGIYKTYSENWEKAANNKFIYLVATLYKIIHKLSVRKESDYVPSIGKNNAGE